MMLFADFEHLKIVKDFHFTTVIRTVVVNSDQSLQDARKIAHTLFSEMIKPDPLAVHYEVFIHNEVVDEDSFLSLVNIFSAEFFDVMATDEGWKREYRLDVPDVLKNLKASVSMIKKAVNRKTVNSRFNLTIHYQDLVYMLCDEKIQIEAGEFIHSVDELEDKTDA